MTKILFDQGYILSYQFSDDNVQGTIKIALKYDRKLKMNIKKLKSRTRSKKVCWRKRNAESSKRTWNCNCFNFKGVMTNKKARQENVGGEVLCYVY